MQFAIHQFLLSIREALGDLARPDRFHGRHGRLHGGARPDPPTAGSAGRAPRFGFPAEPGDGPESGGSPEPEHGREPRGGPEPGGGRGGAWCRSRGHRARCGRARFDRSGSGRAPDVRPHPGRAVHGWAAHGCGRSVAGRSVAGRFTAGRFLFDAAPWPVLGVAVPMPRDPGVPAARGLATTATPPRSSSCAGTPRRSPWRRAVPGSRRSGDWTSGRRGSGTGMKPGVRTRTATSWPDGYCEPPPIRYPRRRGRRVSSSIAERYLHRIVTDAYRRGELSADQAIDALAHRNGWDPCRHPFEQEAMLRRATQRWLLWQYQVAAANERIARQTNDMAATAQRSLDVEARAAAVRASRGAARHQADVAPRRPWRLGTAHRATRRGPLTPRSRSGERGGLTAREWAATRGGHGRRGGWVSATRG